MEKHGERLDLMEENHKETAANATSEASKSEKDLVSGLSDDVVLGEVIPRLSRAMAWDKRPVLSLLSRSWANATARHSSLLYDRAENPSVSLSSQEFIVYRVIRFPPDYPPDYSTDARLWVWDPFRGMKSTIPQPPIPNMLKGFDANFMCDGESVYVLTPSFVPVNVYNVWMLDLREFNIRWKKLPSLPRLGKPVYASICAGEKYIWEEKLSLSSNITHGWKLTGSGENDTWQHIKVKTPPPQNLNFDKSNRLPLYIEIISTNGKFLYERVPLPRHNLSSEFFPSYIFILPDVDSDDSRPIIYGDLYGFHVDKNPDGGLCMLKAEMENVQTVHVKGGGGEAEWSDFVEYWNTDILKLDSEMEIWDAFNYPESDEDDFNYPECPNHDQGFSGVLKVFMPLPSKDTWKIQHKLEWENWMNRYDYTVLKNGQWENWMDRYEFMVVKNGPIYGYELIVEKFEGERDA